MRTITSNKMAKRTPTKAILFFAGFLILTLNQVALQGQSVENEWDANSGNNLPPVPVITCQ